MWVFYLISLPLRPDVPKYVLFSVGYAWFCSLSIIILVPADIWTTIIGHDEGAIAFFWSWSYWSTFALTWAVVPTIQCYEDAGDFTVTERLKTSIRANLIFYLSVGSIGLFGLFLLIIMRRDLSGGIMGLAMACSNTFGLVTGAFLLGFGLSEIPKSIWKNADWIAKMAVNLDDAHQEFSNAIVVAQATSNQMTKRDPMRPYMDVIDNMLRQMLREDPSFKPSGGRLGENDMDYDTDEKSMATLRRQLRRAREEYYRYKSAYMTYVTEALELEDTIKNYERRDSTGWKYVSSFRPTRTGSLGSFLDTVELVWRCILRKQVEKILAVTLGCMSAAILLAEATLLPSGVDLSLFSILINAVNKREMLVQIAAFVPLMYMCICTYYSLFKVGMLMFYSLTPKQTSSVSLLMICSMVARYAAPISYNFLNLIRLGDAKTIFEKRMGNIDDAVPFFGRGFNKIYPLIMVIYTLLVASNFFGHVIEFFAKWKRFKFQREQDDMDGFDPSGVIILQKERLWLEQGRKVGEQVIPLARNFNGASDVESASLPPRMRIFLLQEKAAVEMKVETSSARESRWGGQAAPAKDEDRRYSGKYSAAREHPGRQKPGLASKEKPVSPATVSLLEGGGDSERPSAGFLPGPTSGIASTWASMKTGLQNFRANMGTKKFLPLSHVPEDAQAHIFQKLKKRPSMHRGVTLDDDEDDEEDDAENDSGARS
ncbi:unnamed protein product [Spirodela intermedia]|uniref:Uncharacterized protein n=1 Tax=Spirodela intermedia TaxID=51605 RepID=A0A7I8IM65_SPIIN|nr:unnamed protein product [Spirodela intermedia]CAA6658849.1 unnamed protein product [Spirodela intermedia]